MSTGRRTAENERSGSSRTTDNNYGGARDFHLHAKRLSIVRDPPGQDSLYIPPGDHDLEIYRLSTFYNYPEPSPVKTTLLAMIGFYFTGYRDRVKCFSCGSVVQNFSVSDDAMDPRLHLTDCKMIKGEERRNKPSQFSSLWLLFRKFTGRKKGNFRVGQNQYQDPVPMDIAESSSSTNHINENFQELFLENIVDPSHENILRNLNLQIEVDRRKTYSKWPSYPCPNLPSELAKDGFFYLGNLDRVQCFSCSGVLRNWAPGDVVGEQHRRHFPQCRMASGTDPRNQPMTQAERQREDTEEQTRLSAILPNENTREPPDPSQEEQRHLATYFPCANAVNPHMESVQRRVETFERWPEGKTRATPEQMAEAGMFYLGHSDKTKCYYCNGGLQNWEWNDEPWSEHAKWFPQCEFVLRRKGIEFVERIVQQHPNLNRPAIRNPVSYVNVPRFVASIAEQRNPQTVPVERFVAAGGISTGLAQDEQMRMGSLSGNDASLVTSLREVEESLLCRKCKMRKAEAIVLPCAHLCACNHCVTDMARCATCGGKVHDSIKVYRA